MNKQHNTRAITDDRRFSFVHSLPTRLVTITISHLKKNRRRNIAHAYTSRCRNNEGRGFRRVWFDSRSNNGLPVHPTRPSSFNTHFTRPDKFAKRKHGYRARLIQINKGMVIYIYIYGRTGKWRTYWNLNGTASVVESSTRVCIQRGVGDAGKCFVTGARDPTPRGRD